MGPLLARAAPPTPAAGVMVGVPALAWGSPPARLWSSLLQTCPGLSPPRQPPPHLAGISFLSSSSPSQARLGERRRRAEHGGQPPRPPGRERLPAHLADLVRGHRHLHLPGALGRRQRLPQRPPAREVRGRGGAGARGRGGLSPPAARQLPRPGRFPAQGGRVQGGEPGLEPGRAPKPARSL